MRYLYKGTKSDFKELIEHKCIDFNQDHKNEICVFIKDSSLSIGLQRTGHGGGYWYVSEMVEEDNKTKLCGSIKHYPSRSEVKSNILLDTIYVVIMMVYWPIYILLKLIFKETTIHRRKRLNRFLCEYVGCEIINT